MKNPLVAVRSKVIRPLPMGLSIVGIAAGLLGYKLFSLVPFTDYENPQMLGSLSVNHIQNDILMAPIKALQLTILKFTNDDAYLRFASVTAVITAALFLYLMLRKWYTARVSLLTSIMFITSSWFLHTGRIANTDVLYLSVLPVLLVVCMWFLSKRHDRKMPFSAILLGLLMYIPGTWLFIVGGLILFRKYTWRTLKKLSLKIKLLSALLLIATVAPLVYSFVQRPRQIIMWLGFNENQQLSLKAMASNFADIPTQLFYSGADDPLRWLSGTPIFDLFSVAMLLLGIYAYRAGFYPAREKLLVGATILSILLIGLGNIVTISLLVPLLYIFIANGLAYLLQSWFTVFPHNPVARPLGISLLTLVIAFSCFYQLQRYFVAWPPAKSTRSAINRTD